MNEPTGEKASSPPPKKTRPPKKKRQARFVLPHLLNPYTAFVQKMHIALIAQDPKLSFSERATLISKVWPMMSDENRQVYVPPWNNDNLDP
jgi:hypothetical protein